MQSAITDDIACPPTEFQGHLCSPLRMQARGDSQVMGVVGLEPSHLSPGCREQGQLIGKRLGAVGAPAGGGSALGRQPPSGRACAASNTSSGKSQLQWKRATQEAPSANRQSLQEA